MLVMRSHFSNKCVKMQIWFPMSKRQSLPLLNLYGSVESMVQVHIGVYVVV